MSQFLNEKLFLFSPGKKGVWGVEAEGQQRPDCAGCVKRGSEQVSERRRELELEWEAVREAGARSLGPGASAEARPRGQILIIQEGGVQPGLGEQTHRAEHAGEIATLQHEL